MSTTFAFWADAGMTVPNTAGAVITDGAGPVDRIVYFGSPTPGKTLQASSDPGVDPVEISVADSNESTGISTAAIRLSLSAAGLDSAVPGEPISVGLSIASGASVAIYVRTEQGSLPVGTYADLSLTTNAVVEV